MRLELKSWEPAGGQGKFSKQPTKYLGKIKLSFGVYISPPTVLYYTLVRLVYVLISKTKIELARTVVTHLYVANKSLCAIKGAAILYIFSYQFYPRMNGRWSGNTGARVIMNNKFPLATRNQHQNYSSH